MQHEMLQVNNVLHIRVSTMALLIIDNFPFFKERKKNQNHPLR